MNVTAIVVGFIAILISMTLHEAMHAFVSHWLGDDTARVNGRLTLNPLSHIDPITTVALPLLLIAIGAPPFGAAKPVPFNPYKVKYGEYGAALVGIAGPLTNLVLAIVGAVLLRAGVDVRMPHEFLGLTSAMALFVIINVGFFVFNMIPFPPLDGSRVLYAFAPRGLQRVMESIEAMGFTAIILFMFLIFPLIRAIIFQVNDFILLRLLGA